MRGLSAHPDSPSAGTRQFQGCLIVEASDFVGVKSFKAKGKRLTTYTVGEIMELEPTRRPETEENEENAENESESEKTTATPGGEDENGQMNLF